MAFSKYEFFLSFGTLLQILQKYVSYDCALKIFKMKIQNHYYGYKPKTESYSILRDFWIGINQI